MVRKFTGLPLLLEMPTPCSERWQSMRGDDRVRHCAACNHTIYNLSVLTEEQIAELAGRGTVCVRLRVERDGTVQTATRVAGRGARLLLTTALTALAACGSSGERVGKIAVAGGGTSGSAGSSGSGGGAAGNTSGGSSGTNGDPCGDVCSREEAAGCSGGTPFADCQQSCALARSGDCEGVIEQLAACTSTSSYAYDATKQPVAVECETLQSAFDSCVN